MRVAVLGGGALGCLVALHLAQGSLAVDVIEARDELWRGASDAGEGKVHLGYVYGLSTDPSRRTLIGAALSFAPDVERALGTELDWPALVSSPFTYLVAGSSLVTPEEFERHADRIAALAGDQVRYLGEDVASLHPRRLEETAAGTTYSTPERSVDVPALRSTVLAALGTRPGARSITSTRVVDVEPHGSGGWTIVTGAGDRGHGTLGPYDAVVNCSWESAAHLDRRAGHGAEVPNLRLRAFLHGWSEGPPAAVTVTHGPYGDFVRFADGRTYVSWYPTGLLGFDEAWEAPEEWDALQTAALLRPDLVRSMVEGLAPLVPEARTIREATVHARIVVARGATDIDDPASGLHERADAGVGNHGTWISVRSPKLTTAPQMARAAAEAILRG